MTDEAKFSWVKRKSENQHRSPPVTSFIEILSETLANELQEQDLLEFDREQVALEASLRELDEPSDDPNDCSRDYELALQLSKDPDCSVDAQIALDLQRQFDRELEFQEQLANNTHDLKKGTKIILSTDRFEYSKLEDDDESKNEKCDEEEAREIATDLHYREKIQEFPPCGFKRNEDGQIVTKHDKEIGEKRNCQKMMIFHPTFNCGDVIDSKLSSRIYNDLQIFSKKDLKHNSRLQDKELIAISDASIDVATRLVLLKLINNGDLDRIDGAIAIGKESTVLSGSCDAVEVGTSKNEERHFAIKIHKQTLNAFRNRAEYVKDDMRFKNPRSILKIWTEKEFLNLKRLHKAGLPCPTPILFKKHVLLMSMIEDELGRPAQKLKNYIWINQDKKLAIFNQVREAMVKMFRECNLVHSDLSEFNLLFVNNRIYVIDVAQAVDLSHPRSLIYLQRDINNILSFFERNDTEELPTRHELFSEITSLEVDPDMDLLAQVESLSEQNMSANVAAFRKAPSDYDLMLAIKEQEEAESDLDGE